MKQPRAALRWAAVACSVVLVAGLVSYRAGAFDWVRATPAPVENPTHTPVAEPAVTATPDSGNIINGSKSGIFIVPPGNPAPTGGTAPASPSAPPPTFIGGSKSIAPLIPPIAPAPPDGKAPPAQAASPPQGPGG